jgi:hypothetical protein
MGKDGGLLKSYMGRDGRGDGLRGTLGSNALAQLVHELARVALQAFGRILTGRGGPWRRPRIQLFQHCLALARSIIQGYRRAFWGRDRDRARCTDAGHSVGVIS